MDEPVQPQLLLDIDLVQLNLLRLDLNKEDLKLTLSLDMLYVDCFSVNKVRFWIRCFNSINEFNW